MIENLSLYCVLSETVMRNEPLDGLLNHGTRRNLLEELCRHEKAMRLILII